MARKEIQYSGEKNIGQIKEEAKNVFERHGMDVLKEESTRLKGSKNTSVIVKRRPNSKEIVVISGDRDLPQAIIDEIQGNNNNTRTRAERESNEVQQNADNDSAVHMDVTDSGTVTVDRNGRTETFDLDMGVIVGDATISDGPSVVMFDDRFDWSESSVEIFIEELREELMERSR